MAREQLDVGMKCIKYMLFVSNFMFAMIGFLLISIGSTIHAIYGDFETFMESHYFSPAALMVAIGVIIFLVALFGCIGAIKESTCLVNIFALLLALILILEVAAALAAYSMRGEITENIQLNMESTLYNYENDEFIRDSWDFTQDRLQCCGIKSPVDWQSHLYNGTEVNYENVTFYVPESCCVYGNCTAINGRGCLSRLSYVVSECSLMLGTGAVCVALVQLLGVIFARMLARAIRTVKTEEEMRRQEQRRRLYEQLARGDTKDEKITPVLYTPPYSDKKN